MKMFVKKLMPKSIWSSMRGCKHAVIKTARRLVECAGFVIARKSDYSNPLPSEFELRRHFRRWNKPSELVGLRYDLDAMRKRLACLIPKYYPEFMALEPYEQLRNRGYGPGYPELDALILYAMVRESKPKQYLEVGCGLSTYYCALALQRNAAEGHPGRITCIEPFPFPMLYKIDGIEVVKALVQDAPVERFTGLQAGDILFIDSSHIVRIDGDVPFLFLEALPRLAPGVRVHVHDVPFPFNTPFPGEFWVLTSDRKSEHWPNYWNEAMLLQAFLAFNSRCGVDLSTPMLRHFDEKFLRATIPLYKPLTEEPNTFSSMWLLMQ